MSSDTHTWCQRCGSTFKIRNEPLQGHRLCESCCTTEPIVKDHAMKKLRSLEVRVRKLEDLLSVGCER